ncbi:MAG: oligosaccharide flippase family protein [candidate division WOR-3 bacterium]|nr:MAG: oligosaccharide flippase family protein [candidate division WOR-3 bacterium]
MTKYIKGVTLTYATQITILVMSFITSVIIVRTLGASGKGVVALLQNYFLILVVIFILGMSEGNIYFLSSRKYKHKEVFANVLVHTILISAIFLVASIIFKDWILSTFLRNIKAEHYNLALWIFPAFFLFLHTTTMLLGHHNIVGFNVVTTARFTFIMVFMAVLIPKLQIIGAVIATVAGFLLADIIGVILLTRYGSPAIGINKGFARNAFIFGAKSEVGLILAQLDRRFDIFIINLFLAPTQVGFYAVAVAIAEFPWYVSNAIATVLFPEIAAMDKQRAYQFTSYVCRNTLFIVFILSIVLFVVGGFILQFVFGPEFSQSLNPLRILMPGIVILSVNKVICAGFSGTGRPEYGTLTAVFSAAATITLDFMLIPRMGIEGAAIASTVAYTISATTGILLFSRTANLPLKEFLIITSEDIKRYPEFYRKVVARFRNA